MDYTELKNTVLTILDNDSDEILSLFDIALRTVEAEANKIRTRYMNTLLEIPNVTGEYLDMPSDLLELRRVVLLADGKRTVLNHVSNTGTDAGYTLIGNKIQFIPALEDMTVELNYIQKIPALTELSPTNWLLEQYPQVYVQGLLYKLFSEGLFDEARGSMYQKQFTEQLLMITATEQAAEWNAGPIVLN